MQSVDYFPRKKLSFAQRVRKYWRKPLNYPSRSPVGQGIIWLAWSDKRARRTDMSDGDSLAPSSSNGFCLLAIRGASRVPRRLVSGIEPPFSTIFSAPAAKGWLKKTAASARVGYAIRLSADNQDGRGRSRGRPGPPGRRATRSRQDRSRGDVRPPEVCAPNR